MKQDLPGKAQELEEALAEVEAKVEWMDPVWVREESVYALHVVPK
jgi:hypothetical protein